jgi:hypothetical protein
MPNYTPTEEMLDKNSSSLLVNWFFVNSKQHQEPPGYHFDKSGILQVMSISEENCTRVARLSFIDFQMGTKSIIAYQTFTRSIK